MYTNFMKFSKKLHGKTYTTCEEKYPLKNFILTALLSVINRFQNNTSPKV